MTSKPATEYPDHIDAAVLKIAGVVVLGAIMSILDITVVNVALPTFQTEFGEPRPRVAYSHVAWTVTAYTLALATVIPMTGWAADRFGTKRLYMTGHLPVHRWGRPCARPPPSINMLIGFRVAAGPRRRHADAARHDDHDPRGRPAPDGPADGDPRRADAAGPDPRPDHRRLADRLASWHWIFLINVPLGAIAIVYAWRVLPKDTPEPSESFDFLGMALMSPGLALFLFGVSSLPQEHGDFIGPEGLGLDAGRRRC